MRSKIVLIRGYADIAKHLTLAEFERINADNVAVICALRRPQFLPDRFDTDLDSIKTNVKKLLDHWKSIEQDYLLTAEYASIAIDHGCSDIKAVEGVVLEVPWFFEIVKTLHKHFNQQVIEALVIHRKNDVFLRINEEEYTVQQFVELMGPHDFLG